MDGSFVKSEKTSCEIRPESKPSISKFGIHSLDGVVKMRGSRSRLFT